MLKPLLAMAIFGLCVMAQPRPLQAQSKPTDSDPAALAIAKIVKGREQVLSGVARLQDHFRESDPTCTKKECDQGRKLYGNARGAYLGWVSAVQLAILKGKDKKIDSSSSYKEISDDATKESTVFLNYVDTQIAPSAAVVVFLQSLFNLGIQVWNDIKKAQTEQRQTIADTFVKNATWPTWEDLSKVKRDDQSKPK